MSLELSATYWLCDFGMLYDFFKHHFIHPIEASWGAQMVKNLPAVQETWVRSLGREDPQRRKWQPIPVFLPRESPLTEEPDRLQSMGSQRVGHDWVTNTFTFFHGKERGNNGTSITQRRQKDKECKVLNIPWQNGNVTSKRGPCEPLSLFWRSNLRCSAPEAQSAFRESRVCAWCICQHSRTLFTFS